MKVFIHPEQLGLGLIIRSYTLVNSDLLKLQLFLLFLNEIILKKI